MRVKIILLVIIAFVGACSFPKKVMFNDKAYAKLPQKAIRLTEEQLGKENEKFSSYMMKKTLTTNNFYEIEGMVLGFSEPLKVKSTDESLEKFKAGLDESIKDFQTRDKNRISVNEIEDNKVFLWRREVKQQFVFSFFVVSPDSSLKIVGGVTALKQDSIKAEKVLHDFFKGIKF